MFVCATVSELRFYGCSNNICCLAIYGCCHPCFIKTYQVENILSIIWVEDYVAATILSVLFLLIGIGTIIDVAMRHGADQVIPGTSSFKSEVVL